MEGRNDKPRWEAIQHRMQYAASQRDLYSKSADDARDALVAAHISSVRAFAEKLDGLKGLWAPAATAIRAELEGTRAAQVIAEEIEMHFAAMRSALTKTLNALEAHQPPS